MTSLTTASALTTTNFQLGGVRGEILSLKPTWAPPYDVPPANRLRPEALGALPALFCMPDMAWTLAVQVFCGRAGGRCLAIGNCGAARRVGEEAVGRARKSTKLCASSSAKRRHSRWRLAGSALSLPYSSAPAPPPSGGNGSQGLLLCLLEMSHVEVACRLQPAFVR